MISKRHYLNFLAFILVAACCLSCKKSDASSQTDNNKSFITLAISHTDNVSSDRARLYGSVYNQGNLTIIEKGICYNLTAAPLTTDKKVVAKDEDDTGGHGFSVELIELKPKTLYHARTYAIGRVSNNGEHTYYGSEITFTTL
jgi:hypothetical protein